MLAPIRPSPIIPSCIRPACHEPVTIARVDAPAPDQATLAADLADVVESHRQLTDQLAALPGLHPGRASSLPGWTVGHVLTHIARNADSHVSMLEGHEQYPGGRERRDRDIEAGAGRPWATLVDDVRASIGRLERYWQQTSDWSGTARGVAARSPVAMLPFLRQREVEVHRVDLDVGYTFADMPSRYVRQELRLMVMLWKANKPMGLTPLPTQALAASPADRLAWLMGRGEIEGLGPALVY